MPPASLQAGRPGRNRRQDRTEYSSKTENMADGSTGQETGRMTLARQAGLRPASAPKTSGQGVSGLQFFNAPKHMAARKGSGGNMTGRE